MAVLKHLWVLTFWNVLFLVVDHFLSVGSGAVRKSENSWKVQLLAKYNIDVVRVSSIFRDFWFQTSWQLYTRGELFKAGLR